MPVLFEGTAFLGLAAETGVTGRERTMRQSWCGFKHRLVQALPKRPLNCSPPAAKLLRTEHGNRGRRGTQWSGSVFSSFPTLRTRTRGLKRKPLAACWQRVQNFRAEGRTLFWKAAREGITAKTSFPGRISGCGLYSGSGPSFHLHRLFPVRTAARAAQREIEILCAFLHVNKGSQSGNGLSFVSCTPAPRTRLRPLAVRSPCARTLVFLSLC